MMSANTDMMMSENQDMIELTLDTPGHDVAHVRYVDHLQAWQASTYWCSLAGTVLFERTAWPPGASVLPASYRAATAGRRGRRRGLNR